MNNETNVANNLEAPHMKFIQFKISHKIALAVLLAVPVGLLSIANVQGSSHRPFTLTEVDPTGNNRPGHWQYRAVANTAPGGFSRWQDSPWHWRHYDPTDVGKEHIKCDDTFALFLADPASPDTAVSADGGTVTVNIYQEIDTVWVCFALECDDGTFAYSKIRNLQTEDTLTSGTCGHGAPGTGTDTNTNTPDPKPNTPVDDDEEEEEEEEETTTTNTLTPPVNPINTDPPETNNNQPQQPQTTTPDTTTKDEIPNDQNTPKTDANENDDQTEQTDQEPNVVVDPPVVRVKQYQGDWK